ncbi:hypothetical protein [Roseinatronobacter bogoriensis]|uniref:Translation initiation factor 2 n=1 Tax=Roseinatronobacter bogoriensis subsp. barguzinensis TaxID=441209 RepID=A0A2K8KJ69_9RHOB|nr:hypothetical protein [Rhodobaca]ATX66230.1 hypothetical protein BG454_10745 [Rhodobaca barguzinensis]MBB4207346.1 hypothetical protein [Rhodobaca bogoriensis DSM 18756]TDW40348.1 hypothetical protein LY39_01383 [Rhodobaca barguzinensis]TDY70500.1 hypothetical protein EV660_102174 [Rhodobaca bogoriensis DSM 18756]
MKPNFALGLTDDGVTLWHRDVTGWLRVGAVSLDTPDMDAQMRDMSRIAAAIAPEGVTTKLVIPDDQILYCDLPVSGRTAEAQETEIRGQLAGRTPYPVEELVFDWTIDGNAAKVAVVARETIVEAEDFAAQHGLNPIAAVAAAQKGRSTTEPFFGPTRGARKLVPDTSRIQRDAVPLVEAGHVTLPDPEPVVVKAATPQKADDPSSVLPDAAQSKVEAPKAAPKTKPKDEKPAAQPNESDKQAVTAPAAERPAPQPPAAPNKSELKAAGDRKKDAESKAAAERKQALFAKLNAAKPTSDGQADQPSDAKSKFAQLLAAKRASSTATTTTEQSESSPATEAVSFRSRRGGTESDATATKKTEQTDDLTSRLRKKAFGAKSALSSAFGLGATKADVSAKPDAADTQSVSKAGAPTAKAPPVAKAAKADEKPAKKDPVAAAKPEAKAKPADKAKVPPPRKGPIETLQAHGGQSRSQSSEAERLTIFGARSNQDMQPSGTSRAMLVLGGVGLLLVAAAIWAAYFFTTQPSDVQLAEEPSQSAALEPEITEPTAPDIGLDDIEASLGVEHAAQQAPLDGPDMPALLEEDVAQAPAEQAPTEAEMGTEEMQAGRIAGLRSVALFAPQEATSLPATPAAPAPFGSEPLAPLRSETEQAAVLDAAEPIIEDEPTAEAPTDALPALPEGEELLEIAVSDGTPSSVPPARPEGLAPELETPAEVETAAPPEDVVEQVPEAASVDPLDESQLQITVTSGPPAATPPARPEGLAPEQAQPTETAPEETAPALSPEATQSDEPGTADSEEAALDAPALGGISLTALRPAARPEALVVDMPDTQEAETASFADATDLAVAASRRPGSRPSQFSAIVQRTLRSAQPEPTPAQPQQSEPIQTARAAVPDAPAIPTSASVAREATQARAINLRQINLLGVMGTSSSRRALVRLSNGRVVTVRVGETLDGGQVTAIGDDELRYTRRGRDVVLRIAS